MQPCSSELLHAHRVTSSAISMYIANPSKSTECAISAWPDRAWALGDQEVWHGSKSGEGGFLHSPLLEELKSLELNLGAPGVRTLPRPCLQSPSRGAAALEHTSSRSWLCLGPGTQCPPHVEPFNLT